MKDSIQSVILSLTDSFSLFSSLFFFFFFLFLPYILSFSPDLPPLTVPLISFFPSPSLSLSLPLKSEVKTRGLMGRV